jgi:hypothetical protein
MDVDNCADQKSRDNIRRPFRFMLFFGIPIVGLLGANFLTAMPLLHATVDIISFAWMGIACLVNALECNRVHCWFTGPWCLLVAMALLAYEFLGIQPARISFAAIVNAGFIIFLLLWFVPELILGRYFRQHPGES